jgi:hypothetical protein
MSSFYLTLPSNSSMSYYPNNTLTHFMTKLPSRINLEGDWEVGLTEMQYPHSWYNVKEEDTRQVVNNGTEGKFIDISEGYYDSLESLTTLINKTIIAQTKDKVAQVYYNPFNQKVVVDIKPNGQLCLTNGVKALLGYNTSQGTFLGETNGMLFKSPNTVQTDLGMYAFYVYSDITEPRVVGDSMVPLLRTVPIAGKHGESVVKYFQNIDYVPVMKKSFDTIEIDIRDDTGKHIPFEYGKLVVTLHFRKKRLLL